MIFEMLEFARATETVLDWATERDDTLIIVAGNQPVGGLMVERNFGVGELPKVRWNETANEVPSLPIYAWGPSSERLTELDATMPLLARLNQLSTVEQDCNPPTPPEISPTDTLTITETDEMPAISPTPFPTATPLPPITTTHTITLTIQKGIDDAEENKATGEISLSSSDLELMLDWVGLTEQLVGLRFRDVPLPANAEILTATLTFTADEAGDTYTKLLIHGEATGDAGIFTDETANLSDRRLTSAVTVWENMPAWTDDNLSYHSPSLTYVIQEIINQEDWQSGNALVLLISGEGQRIAESFDGAPDESATLQIIYR